MDENPRWLIFKWDDEGEPVGLCTVRAKDIREALLEGSRRTVLPELNACLVANASDRTVRQAEERDAEHGYSP
jgi:hypothetical protein